MNLKEKTAHHTYEPIQSVQQMNTARSKTILLRREHKRCVLYSSRATADGPLSAKHKTLYLWP